MLRFAFLLLLLVSLVHADEYDDLRLRWRDSIVGVGYNTADPDVVAKLVSIANSANNNWASMDKSPTRTFLWSGTLTGAWSTVGVTQSLVPGSDNGITQQWKATMPSGANGRRFVRLRVTRP